MSLKLLNEIENFQKDYRAENKVQLRIGIHSGQCTAGVVGLRMLAIASLGWLSILPSEWNQLDKVIESEIKDN